MLTRLLGGAAVAVMVVHSAFAAPPPAAQVAPQTGDSTLTGTVLDSSGLPLIGAFIAVGLPGNEEPTTFTASDQHGRFAVSLAPGNYRLMAASFGHVSAIVPSVQMPRAEPVRLQLRSERQVVSLLSDAAPLDIGYAFRPGVRDVLRTEAPVGVDAVMPADTADTTWINNVREGSAWANVGGELSLWTMASGTDPVDDSRSATEFSMGSVGSSRQSWVFQGQIAEGGVVRARSELSRVMSDAHVVEVGVGFAGKDLVSPDVDTAPRSMWVGSLAVEDFWRIGEALQVGYGLRWEHYNYLEETGLVSPRMQIAYAPIDSVVLTAGVAYDAEAPGLAELRFQVDPLAVRYMDVIGVAGIDPERTLRYELGMQSAGSANEWRARVYHDEVADELVGVYLANSLGSSDYLVANLGDSTMRGIELDFRRSFMDLFAARASYGYSHREGAALPTAIAAERGLLANGFDPEAASVDTVHQVAAGIETVFGRYDTRFDAMYRVQVGVPVVRAGQLEDHYERVDLRVRQPLPFRTFSSDWSALLQVQNAFDNSYEGVFDFSLGNAPVLTRLISGGLAVRF